jgi:hypothetical protein
MRRPVDFFPAFLDSATASAEWSKIRGAETVTELERGTEDEGEWRRLEANAASVVA